MHYTSCSQTGKARRRCRVVVVMALHALSLMPSAARASSSSGIWPGTAVVLRFLVSKALVFHWSSSLVLNFSIRTRTKRQHKLNTHRRADVELCPEP